MIQVQRSKENFMKKTVSGSTSSADSNTTKAQARRERLRSQTMQTVMDFDKLPDSAYVRLQVAEVLLDCSPSTVWRKIKQRVLPQPRRFGSNVALLNVGEMRKAIRSM